MEEVNALPRNRIRDDYIWLTENLEFENDLLSHLYATKVLTHSEFDKYAADKSNPMKIHWFLSIIGRKSNDDFETFIQLLAKTEQGHVSKRLSEPLCEFHDFRKISFGLSHSCFSESN